jgi:chemotaxis protein MotB
MSKKADGGAPAWIVTFADLMSLLLTFFVLLLSFSNMEVQEFKKVAGSMRSAFGLQSLDRLAGLIELEGFTSSTAVKHVVQIPIPEQDITDVVLPPEPEIVDEETEEPVQEVPDLQAEASRRTFNDLQELMASEIAADVMALIRSGNSTVIRFPDRQSFASGEGEMKPEFIPILSKVLKQLEKEKGQIIISGHTDNIPIHTEKYRSNWDLSASRATSVAQYIMDHTTITKDQITVQGYADSRPLAPNDSELNRAKNRRVEITVKLDESIVPAAP